MRVCEFVRFTVLGKTMRLCEAGGGCSGDRGLKWFVICTVICTLHRTHYHSCVRVQTLSLFILEGSPKSIRLESFHGNELGGRESRKTTCLTSTTFPQEGKRNNGKLAEWQ